MTEEKTCCNCGNKNCHIFYSTVKQDAEEHYETYEYRDFDCVNHDKWEEMKVEEIRTDNTETLINALERIEDLKKENSELKADNDARKFAMAMSDKVEKQLREENEVLKLDLNKKENTVHTFDVLHKEAVKKYGEVNDKLTKAKEIIEKLLNAFASNDFFEEEELAAMAEAEQFLKETK